ncbi:hypothetical protein M0R45_001697 [Rubus argutus]|uniref:Uncharacterized protein n=1 Tax=Rubus argutus TaxID=59490 RepID=A0AAW1VK96_RUBAR
MVSWVVKPRAMPAGLEAATLEAAEIFTARSELGSMGNTGWRQHGLGSRLGAAGKARQTAVRAGAVLPSHQAAAIATSVRLLLPVQPSPKTLLLLFPHSVKSAQAAPSSARARPHRAITVAPSHVAVALHLSASTDRRRAQPLLHSLRRRFSPSTP